jgi:hypothetical protein
MNFFRNAFFGVCLVIFASWTNEIPESNIDINSFQDITYEEFISDAYNYRTKNNVTIPDHYYTVLNIKKQQPPVTQTVIKKPTPVEVVQKPSLVPKWVFRGILMRESKSYYDENNKIVYVDRGIGAHGELGPFQLTPIAFEQVKQKNEKHRKVMWNMEYAQELTERYLLWLYNGPANKNWNTTIRMYNGGPGNYLIDETLEYLNAVRKFGKKN